MRRTTGAGLGVAAIAFAVATACTEPTSVLELTGTYPLVTVNGVPLPFTVLLPGATLVEVLEDTFTLHPGGTYAEAGLKRSTTRGVVTYSWPVDAGNFLRRGDEITLQSLVYTSRAATLRNGELTLIDQDVTLIYRK